MAGGKETPRQKMIGMMYLVLTALLALNVSKTILDAFVAIEENVQISSENEILRGEEKRSDLKAKAEDPLEASVQKKAIALMKTINQIDKLTAERIRFIDKLKMNILKECGEDVVQIGKEKHIVYETFKDPLKPMRLKLEFVEGKDKYDEPMNLLIGDDITQPNATGMKLWNSYLGYRNELTELIASSALTEGKKHFFKAPKISKYANLTELYAKIDKSIEGSNVAEDDKEAIKKIYASLTKQERSEVNEVKNVHWIGKTFDHAPSVAALASLSALQKEILTARADAVTLVESRVGGGEYSFNKIMPLAYGPEVINQNEEAEIQVLMAAYDSDKQPVVKVTNGTLRDTKDGKGFITAKGSGNEIKLSGTITILNKSGIPKTMPWEKTIRVMKPSGVVSLPKMNILYRNYPNEIMASASGFEETVLNGSSGLGLTKSGDKYIGKINTAGRTATISISGRNKGTGKLQQLGTYTYRVMNLPPPTAFLGTIPTGTATVAQVKAMTSVFTKYTPDVPLEAQFKVVSYDINVSGAPKPAIGNGSGLDGKATGLLKQVQKGSIVTILLKYSGPTNGYVSATIKVI